MFGEVGIDSIAGPSEILILADETSDPETLAWDLMAQSEHDADASSSINIHFFAHYRKCKGNNQQRNF